MPARAKDGILRSFASLTMAFLLASGVCGQAPDPGLDLLNRGLEAYKAGRYADATADFRQAVEANPTAQAHQYLGAAYAAQIVPNLETPRNRALGDAAIEQFEAVLTLKPDDKVAIEQEASVYRNLARFDEAKAAEVRALRVDPENPAVPYTIGVIDWQQAYKNAAAILAKAGLKDDGVGNSSKGGEACAALQTQNAAWLADAIANLTRAIELKPDYSDAMTYLSLVYRRRADLHCFDPVSVKADIDLAETWAQRAKDARVHASAP